MCRRKKSKTLSGIETEFEADLNLAGLTGRSEAGKNLKPYQGLKQLNYSDFRLWRLCRKKSKTLSGIETLVTLLSKGTEILAGKNLKPYQGLKRI